MGRRGRAGRRGAGGLRREVEETTNVSTMMESYVRESYFV